MNQNSCHRELQSAAIAYQLNLVLVTCYTEYDFVLGIETKGDWGGSEGRAVLEEKKEEKKKSQHCLCKKAIVS